MTDVRLCTFNVRLDTPSDAPADWEHRRAGVIETLERIDPDIICLQEPFFHQLTDIEAGLPAYDWFGEGRFGGNEGEFCPIGWRRSRLTLEDSTLRWLSESPTEPGTVGWDGAFPRIVTITRLSVDERSFAVWNTHFDHEGATARLEAAGLLREWLADRTGSILAGDFNCEPGSPPFTELAARLTYAREAARETLGPTGTFNDFTGTPGEAIDHVFVTPDIQIERCETVVFPDEDPLPSDHFPVVVDLTIPDEA